MSESVVEKYAINIFDKKAICDIDLEYVDYSNIKINPGICVADDNEEIFEVNNSLNVSFDNIDTGSEENDTWYYVYLIKYQGTLSQKISKNPVNPNCDYDYFRRIGSVKNNPIGNFLRFMQEGIRNKRQYTFLEDYDSVLEVLANSSSSSYNDVHIDNLVPETSKKYNLGITHRANYIYLRPKGLSVDFFVCVDDGYCVREFPIIDNEYIIQFKTSTGSKLYLSVIGYKEYL